MNEVVVTGGNRFQKEIVAKTGYHMIKVMMPRMRTLYIEVAIKKMKGDAVGYCMMGDDNRDFEIEVANHLTLKDFVETICHEMVHVKQFARNEMSGDGKRWKKKNISENTDYWQLPWEKEAHKKQHKLAQMVWMSDIL